MISTSLSTKLLFYFPQLKPIKPKKCLPNKVVKSKFLLSVPLQFLI